MQLASPPLPTSPSKLLLGCFVGNALEWFDFAIYGYLASTIGQLFFPNLDPRLALLSSYGVFAAAFLMRPLGAILFGHLGDRWGRRKALLWSLCAMAIPTGIMGLLPVYEQIGILAPFFLLICRMMQGISVGGEFSGSIIFLAEHAPTHRRSFFSTWPDMGGSIGMIGASLTILLLNASLAQQEMLSWGWRIPFIISFILALWGYRLRRHFVETPEFLAQRKKRSSSWPLRILFQRYKTRFILAITFLMANSAGYYILIVFIPNQNFHQYPQAYGALATVFNLIVMMPAMISGALCSDKIGQIRCLKMGYLGCLVLAFPLLDSAVHGSFGEQLIWQGLFAFCLGFSYGPRSSFIAEIFPTSIRYSAIALSYNIGNALFGGTAPLVCALLVDQTGNLQAPAYYIVIGSFISLGSIFFLGAKQKSWAIQFEDRMYKPDYRTHTSRKFRYSLSSPQYPRQKKS